MRQIVVANALAGDVLLSFVCACVCVWVCVLRAIRLQSDCVRLMLEDLPEFLDPEYIIQQMELKKRALRITNADIAEKVMSNYSSFGSCCVGAQ